MTDLSLAETQLGQAGTHVDLGPLSQSGGSHAGKEKAGGRMRESNGLRITFGEILCVFEEEGCGASGSL